MSLRTVKFTSIFLYNLVTILMIGRAQQISSTSHNQTEDDQITKAGLLSRTITGTPSPAVMPMYIRHRRAIPDETVAFCLAPPQPDNGEWKLDKFFCKDTRRDCTVPENASLEPGSQIVYSCNTGYRLKGNTDVYCRGRGKWSRIPSCIEIKCLSLNSASTMLSCTRFGKWMNCDSPVPPETRGEVTCRRGYKKDTDFITTRRGVVNCNANGKWEPEPIRCVPVCGVSTTHQQPFVSGGTTPKIADFPWHASLFIENSPKDNTKIFLCGATIIQTNLVLTAAHCVYNERTKTIEDPHTLFLITGNIFRDYDSTHHNKGIVRKAKVKNVYTYCNYYGITGNYASDIALLELAQPFEFSNILLPACLDDSDYSDQFLEPGIHGRVAGFGRTNTGVTSSILQTITVPYISYRQCKATKYDDQIQAFISNDKFCAGYNNGSAVCEGDSGGGLVFRKGDLWYVMGIVSVGLGVDIKNGERTCDKYSYSLYTKVSIYMTWIQDVMFYMERNQPYPSCDRDLQTSVAPRTEKATPITTSTESISISPPVTNWWDSLTTASPKVTVPHTEESSCLAPPQPNDGQWSLHENFCEGKTPCNISQGTPLKTGSQLVYQCNSGFKAQGTTDVYCRARGTWTPIPTCIEPKMSDCECVVYYRCTDAAVTDIDPTGLIDIRLTDSPCKGYLDICCPKSAIILNSTAIVSIT